MSTSTSATSSAQIYLAKKDGELVLHQGVNPIVKDSASTRVLIVGGGVTGLTVSLTIIPVFV